jgi:hypothetical protein
VKQWIAAAEKAPFGGCAGLSFRCHCVQLIVCLVQSRRRRRFASLVDGRGNVVWVPGFVARAEAAGLALGDKTPVRLTSRGDYDHARLVSSALA